MSVPAELAAAALMKIFSNVAPSGRNPIEARALGRLWQATGLRRADLAVALRTMVEAGRIRTEHGAGACQYFLVRHGGASSPAAERQPVIERELEALAGRAVTGTRPSQSDRRRAPGAAAQPSSERRGIQKNRLLAVLPAACYEEMNQHLDFVLLPRGLVLWQYGETMRHAYFPADCIMSMMIEMSDGAPCEIAMVGNEGMIDVSSLLGVSVATRHAQVEKAGYAYRIAVDVLLAILNGNEAATQLLLRYAAALMNEISQTAACNRHHTLDQQLCRLLLSSLDRMRSPRLALTHEALSNLLGVRREGVTQAIGRLRAAGLISCERGVIIVQDRQSLAQKSCECYQAIRREYNRIRNPADAARPVVRQVRPDRAVSRIHSDGSREKPGLIRM